MTDSDNGWFVTKRDGELEPVDVNKIVKAVSRCAVGLESVDPMRVATRTISGLYDGATTRDLDKLSVQTAANLVAEEPQYSKLAARLLATSIEKEVHLQGCYSFSQSVDLGHKLGLINDRLMEFTVRHARKLNDAIRYERDDEFEYIGLRTLYDRYLIKHPETRQVIESPQHFFMRVASALAESPKHAVELYTLFSTLQYVPSTPTLFNAGTKREQLSSCYLLDSPADDLRAIYDRYTDIALLSQLAGGIGVAYTRVRSRGSPIKGTNGQSNGIVPWLKTLDSSVSAVDQGSRRKGAACVYIEPWHDDIEEFLELRDNTGDLMARTYNLNLALWIPDLFMKRVEADQDWSLFDPSITTKFPDLWGHQFDQEYELAERNGLARRTVRARDLYSKMMRMLAQTGNGWICFKDRGNQLSNQTMLPQNVVHLSNLCTEIIEVSTEKETAVCNLGSINLSRHMMADGQMNWDQLATTVRAAIRQLDNVIDINYYPIDSARTSNSRWRPIGLGVMGLQDVFFKMGVPFDSDEARKVSAAIAERIYYEAVSTSSDLAKEKGKLPSFGETRTSFGWLHPDEWGAKGSLSPDQWEDDGDEWGREIHFEVWDALREKVKKQGLRNSLLIAIAPTATIATIAGTSECIEPQVSNLFKKETLSGDFVQINKYLVADLKKLGLWNEEMLNRLKLSEGSVQLIPEIPDELKQVYRTAWELPMKSLIEMAAARGPFIDQSQSLNLFMENPAIGPMSSMYFYAWKSGLKTTYYLRSRSATRMAKATTEHVYTDEEAVACSLESPESCEACQ